MTTQSIADFLEELASATPTPGGGGAAALMGAMGAGLIAMVAQVTVGKKRAGYAVSGNGTANRGGGRAAPGVYDHDQR